MAVALRMSRQGKKKSPFYRIVAADKRKAALKLARDGVKSIAVVNPGFSADCIETLEEIAGEAQEIFRHAGGENFSHIPCLNDSDDGMDVIETIARRELGGWI